MPLRPKRPRLRLETEPYRRLRQQVLERDGWHCQYCGALTELQVHHFERRSQLGNDDQHNLITLCVGCHKKAHRQ